MSEGVEVREFARASGSELKVATSDREREREREREAGLEGSERENMPGWAEVEVGGRVCLREKNESE